MNKSTQESDSKNMKAAMPRFEPKNPDFRAVATATFDAQRAMHTLGI
jgi:hypothetical protein